MQVMQYAKVEPRVGGVALHYKKVATPPERWSTFDRFADQAAAQHRGCVFVDQVECRGGDRLFAVHPIGRLGRSDTPWAERYRTDRNRTG